MNKPVQEKTVLSISNKTEKTCNSPESIYVFLLSEQQKENSEIIEALQSKIQEYNNTIGTGFSLKDILKAFRESKPVSPELITLVTYLTRLIEIKYCVEVGLTEYSLDLANEEISSRKTQTNTPVNPEEVNSAILDFIKVITSRSVSLYGEENETIETSQFSCDVSDPKEFLSKLDACGIESKEFSVLMCDFLDATGKQQVLILDKFAVKHGMNWLDLGRLLRMGTYPLKQLRSNENKIEEVTKVNEIFITIKKFNQENQENTEETQFSAVEFVENIKKSTGYKPDVDRFFHKLLVLDASKQLEILELCETVSGLQWKDFCTQLKIGIGTKQNLEQGNKLPSKTSENFIKNIRPLIVNSRVDYTPRGKSNVDTNTNQSAEEFVSQAQNSESTMTLANKFWAMEANEQLEILELIKNKSGQTWKDLFHYLEISTSTKYKLERGEKIPVKTVLNFIQNIPKVFTVDKPEEKNTIIAPDFGKEFIESLKESPSDETKFANKVTEFQIYSDAQQVAVIKEFQVNMKLSQEEVAEFLDIENSVISSLYNNESPITERETIEKVLNVLKEL